MLARMRITLALVALALLAPELASAQEMGQGAAHITTRSDVRLSLESVPGTSGARLAALGRALGTAMTPIRQCYHDVVAERPTVRGRIRLRVTHPERGAVQMDVVEDGPGDAPLMTCIQRALRAADLAAVERPAAAVMVLELANSAAEGAEATARRAEEADDVEVTQVEGRGVARGEGPGVAFVIRGAAGLGDEVVADGWRVVRSAMPGMLDCRRRAGRRGRSPAGVVTLSARWRAGTMPDPSVVSSTVGDEAAGTCLQRLLRRPHRRPEAGPGELEIEITFAE